MFNALLHEDFRVGIDAAGCLVQNQDAGIGYHRAGKGEQLLLTDGKTAEWKKQSTAMAAAGIAVILLTIAAGCVPSVGLQGSIFVLLPYAVQLAAACSLAWACARLLGKEYPLREYVYQQTVCKISLRSGVCIAAAGVSVIGELAELTRHSDKILFSIPFLLIEVVMGAATLVLLKNVKKYTWKRARL